MAAKKGKKIKVQDLKPKKDAKGGVVLNSPGANNPGGLRGNHSPHGAHGPHGPHSGGH
jgi:hypothetical protein